MIPQTDILAWRSHALDFESHPLAMQSEWYEGECLLQTYCLDELLGTKLRALYQRRKGRDLFDLWYAMSKPTFNREVQHHPSYDRPRWVFESLNTYEVGYSTIFQSSLLPMH